MIGIILIISIGLIIVGISTGLATAIYCAVQLYSGDRK